MEVRFNGGPFHGQTKEIGDEPEEGQTIKWPPNADLGKQEDAVSGVDDYVEYLYRGDGSADYVGGLMS